jgi:vacuolar-type H+-ATPase subunit I/STV1
MNNNHNTGDKNMKVFDKSKHSANKSVVSDISKIQVAMQREINKVLKKYDISEESLENQQIAKLEKENIKLKEEIRQLREELKAIKQIKEEQISTKFDVRKDYIINGKQCSAKEFESRLRNNHYEVNITLYYTNQRVKHDIWKVDNFTQKSSLSGNLHSGYLRGWREKGITAIRLELNI